MNITSYIRVSGKSQKDGEGPDRQRDSISKFCVGRLTNVGEFFEVVSGTVEGMDRPGFAEMVEAIECRRINGEEIEGFVIERMDRLARDLMVQELILSECRKRNIKVFSTDQGNLIDMASDSGDPTRKLIRQILGALVEWEKSALVLKLKKAREAIKRKTGRCEGGVPYGATPQEKVVIAALRMYVEPTTELESVANFLNTSGYRNRRGNLWNKKSALQLMKAVGVWTRKPIDLERLRHYNTKRKEQAHGRTIQSV